MGTSQIAIRHLLFAILLFRHLTIKSWYKKQEFGLQENEPQISLITQIRKRESVKICAIRG